MFGAFVQSPCSSRSTLADFEWKPSGRQIIGDWPKSDGFRHPSGTTIASQLCCSRIVAISAPLAKRERKFASASIGGVLSALINLVPPRLDVFSSESDCMCFHTSLRDPRRWGFEDAFLRYSPNARWTYQTLLIDLSWYDLQDSSWFHTNGNVAPLKARVHEGYSTLSTIVAPTWRI